MVGSIHTYLAFGKIRQRENESGKRRSNQSKHQGPHKETRQVWYAQWDCTIITQRKHHEVGAQDLKLKNNKDPIEWKLRIIYIYIICDKGEWMNQSGVRWEGEAYEEEARRGVEQYGGLVRVHCNEYGEDRI